MEKSLLEKGINAKEGLEKKCRGPMFLSNAYGKVPSRYLKPPLSSCHDLCKYGHKHEFEDEKKHNVFRRFMKNSSVSDFVQNHVRDLNIGDRRKSSGLKLKASDKARVLMQNMQPEGEEISIKTPSEDHTMDQEKKSIEFPLQTIRRDSSVEVDLTKSSNSNNKKKMKAVKPKASAASESPMKQDIFNQSSSTPTEITSGSGPNIFKEKVASYMKETITSSELKLNRQKKMTVRKLHGSSKLQSEKKNASLPSKNIDGSAKPSISLKERVPLLSSVAQLNATGNNLEASRNSDRKAGTNFKALEVGDGNLLKLQKASLRKFKKLGHAILERNKKPDDGVDIHENIQEIIETKSENDENLSKEGDGYRSDSCVSELSEIEDAKRKQSCGGPSEKEDKRRLRDDSSSLPYKMKFKRGRVIDPRPTESAGPRKLRFRRGRVIDQSSNGESMKRIIRKGDKGNVRAPGAAAALANSSHSGTVLLKHQDAQVKKEMQALFNYVIEETANKLVETRKSKVKALVGAFETVISLQETKAAQGV